MSGAMPVITLPHCSSCSPSYLAKLHIILQGVIRSFSIFGMFIRNTQLISSCHFYSVKTWYRCDILFWKYRFPAISTFWKLKKSKTRRAIERWQMVSSLAMKIPLEKCYILGVREKYCLLCSESVRTPSYVIKQLMCDDVSMWSCYLYTWHSKYLRLVEVVEVQMCEFSFYIMPLRRWLQ